MIYIDLSYAIFYRYFATYSWYSKQEDVDPKKPMKDEVFRNKYDKLFEKMLQDLQKAHKTKEIIIGIDCPREHIWRTALYPEYKAGRETSSVFDGEIFTHTLTKLLPELSKIYNIRKYSHPKLEADDIIAILVRNAPKDENKVIITGDYDYKQLLILDNIKIINLKGQEFVLEDNFLQIKIIMGDKSDNIPAIAKKVGIKTAQKLAKDPEALDLFYTKHPNASAQYLANQKLISFDFIPSNYVKEILALV